MTARQTLRPLPHVRVPGGQGGPQPTIREVGEIPDFGPVLEFAAQQSPIQADAGAREVHLPGLRRTIQSGAGFIQQAVQPDFQEPPAPFAHGLVGHVQVPRHAEVRHPVRLDGQTSPRRSCQFCKCLCKGEQVYLIVLNNRLAEPKHNQSKLGA